MDSMISQGDCDAEILDGGTVTHDRSRESRRSRRSATSYSVKVAATAKFIKGTEATKTEQIRSGQVSLVHSFLHSAVDSAIVELLMSLVVVFDLYLNCYDIDARAMHQPTPVWVQIFSSLCFAIYCADFVLILFVKGASSFIETATRIDFVVICSGVCDYILGAMGISTLAVQIVRVLRFVRLLRLLRLFRKSSRFKELRKLVLMIMSCLRTLFWSFIFCFLMMTVWAMMFVELIQPIVASMESAGEFSECEYCQSAYTSVWFALLTLFKTVIAGDGWSQMALPVIQAKPWTAILFVGSHLTLVYDVLNLILAVVVDTAAEHRQKDVLNLAQEIEAEAEDDMKTLTKMFKTIDEDRNGELSLQELRIGAKKVQNSKVYSASCTSMRTTSNSFSMCLMRTAEEALISQNSNMRCHDGCGIPKLQPGLSSTIYNAV